MSHTMLIYFENFKDLYYSLTGLIIYGMNERKPTIKQQHFIDAVVADPDQAKAARTAGYSHKTAATQGARLHKKFKTIIEKERAKIAKDLGIDKHYVLRRLKEIDELDVLDILDKHGNVLPITKWPKEWRTSIAGIEVSTVGGGGENIAETVKKIKWPDKTKNLDMIGKHTKVGAWNKEDDTPKATDGPQIYIIRLPDNGR